MDTFVPKSGRSDRCTLTVLATSDLHLHLCPWNYYTDRPAPGTGLAAAADHIAALRAGLPNALLFDNGDFLQGNPLAEAVAAARPPGPGRTHPMIEAMNLLAYDAVALGNHDFNYGLTFLENALAGAQFPVLCANLRRVDGRAPLFGGWTILERRVTCEDGRVRPLRLGVAGVLPPQVMLWDQAHLQGRMRAEGIVDCARRIVPQMIAAGAEVVVMLCHAGIGTTDDGADPEAENAALALAGLPGVDAVVAGHSHQVFPGPDFAPGPDIDLAGGRLAGKPACMPGHGGSHLGVLRLVLERDQTARRWRCVGGDGAAVSLAAVAGAGPPAAAAIPSRGPALAATVPATLALSDPGSETLTLTLTEAPAMPSGLSARLMALCLRTHAETRRHLDRPAGATEVPLHSYFALIGDCAATRLVARAQAWHVGRMLAGTPLGHLPVLGAASPSRAGGRGGPGNFADLPPGPLRERDLAALCPYPNAIRALRVTGADLAAWLDHGAQVFEVIPPGSRDAPLLNPDWPAYDFDIIDGLSYRIDLSRRDRRIVGLSHHGRPVAPDDAFILATHSFRAAGGGGFPACGTGAQVVLSAPTPVRSIVGAFLSLEGPWRQPATPVWQFVAMPGTTVAFDTGPGALGHLPVPGLEPRGPTDAGFLRMRLAL